MNPLVPSRTLPPTLKTPVHISRALHEYGRAFVFAHCSTSRSKYLLVLLNKNASSRMKCEVSPRAYCLTASCSHDVAAIEHVRQLPARIILGVRL